VPSLLLNRPATPRPSGRGGLTLACRALPRELRADVEALYGVFRVLDDLVDDEVPGAASRVAAVAEWAAGGRPRSPEADTLEALDARRPIPREAMAAFCRGMEHDLARRAIVSEGDLDEYCRCVAGSVALVVTAWLGERRPCRDAAVALGVALQRTNVLRDVDEDAARGRTYLPEATLARFGPPVPGRRTALYRFEAAVAEGWYRRGLAGIDALARGRAAVAVAAATYREVLREIERGGYDLRAGRAVVPARRRAAVALAAGLAA
jgi:15-cis-phytoene synthase